MSPRIASMRSESLLTFGGIVVNAGLAFLVTWMIANGFGPELTGDFFLLTALFAIVMSVLTLGADTGMVRTLSRQMALAEYGAVRQTVRLAVLPVVVLGAVAGVTVFLTAHLLTDVLGLRADAESAVRALAIALAPGALLAVLLGGSRGLGRVVTYTGIQNLFVPVARTAAVAVAAYVLVSPAGVIWAWASPLVVACALATMVLALQLRAVPAADAEPPARRVLAGRFWRFSLPRGGAVVLERALDWADVLIVIALLGPGAGGVYGVVTRIVMAGAMLEAALRLVLGPRLSAAAAVDDHERAQRLFGSVTTALILLSWPYYIAVAVFAYDVLALFGPAFVEGAPALVVLAIAMGVRNTAGALQTVLLMTGRSHWQLGNKAAQLAVLIAAALLLAPVWGITGAAVAYAVSVVADTALAAFQVGRRLGYRSDPRTVLTAATPPIVIILAGALAVQLTMSSMPAWTRLIGLAAVMGVYVAALAHLVVRRGWRGRL